MQIPVKPKERDKLKESIASLKHNPAFIVFSSWLRDELAKRDRENRFIGNENKSSEAEALSDILTYIDACWTPMADLDETDSMGVESISAVSTI